jgi:hypothetical protein
MGVVATNFPLTVLFNLSHVEGAGQHASPGRHLQSCAAAAAIIAEAAARLSFMIDK